MSVFWAGTTVWARDKIDVVFLKNGDRVTSEIKKLERGKLTVKTDSMGTIEIEWDDIDRVISNYTFEVEVSDGQKFLGSIQPAVGGNQLQISAEAGPATLDHMSVVRVTPIEQSFWERIDGSIDIGFSFARANRKTEWDMGFESNYRVTQSLTSLSVDSAFTEQAGTENTNRHTATLQFRRFLGHRWFGLGLGQARRNDELSLDLRTTVGGGLGRNLVQTNRTLFSLIGGFTFNREEFSSQEAASSAEGMAGIEYQTFTFDTPKMDGLISLFLLPNLSSLGRVRGAFDARIRYEIFKDFFFSVAGYDDFDSDPPGGAERNDFGVSTSVG